MQADSAFKAENGRFDGSTNRFVVSGVSKHFDAVTALEDVALTVEGGEVHGLVGENGSGKSTLVKIIAGYLMPERGATLRAWGEDVAFPVDAALHGVAAIHQDLALIDDLSALENIGLIRNYDARAFGTINWDRETEIAEDLCRRLDVELDLGMLIRDMEPAERAVVAIVRGLRSLDSVAATDHRQLLILDEPTSYLSGADAARIGRLVKTLAATGVAVILVSHHLHEIVELCDSVTVLRNGSVVTSSSTAGLSTNDLIKLMLGREISAFYPSRQNPEAAATLLRVEGLSGRKLRSATFSLCSGEIVGVTGLLGMGQEEIPYLIVGDSNRTGGQVIGPTGHEICDLQDAFRQSVALLPGDRKRLSLQMDASALDNICLPVLGQFARFGFVRSREQLTYARELMEEYSVTPLDPSLPLTAFSGGNQQKLALARKLQTNPAVLLLDEPTNGVDAGAKPEIMDMLAEHAAAGAAVGIFSTDTEQLAAVCDRVLVLTRGHIVAELAGADVSADSIFYWINGGTPNVSGSLGAAGPHPADRMRLGGK